MKDVRSILNADEILFDSLKLVTNARKGAHGGQSFPLITAYKLHSAGVSASEDGRCHWM